jgi:hypothetical protein
MEKKRTLYSLESGIRKILEDNDFVSTGDEGGKQWYMNLITDLAIFVQQELEKAREEGEKKYQKSEFLIDSAGNVYMDTMPRIRIGDNTKHDGTTVGDFRRLYYKIN